MENINVAIVDGNERIIEVATNILERNQGIHIVGSATDGLKGLDLIRKTNPDIVLMDLIQLKQSMLE